jgi:hypothetical protein
MNMRPHFGEFAMGACRRSQAESIGEAEPNPARAHEIACLRRLVRDRQAYGDRATARIGELEAEVAEAKRRLAERDVRDATGVTGDAAKRKAAERALRYRERKKQAAHRV